MCASACPDVPLPAAHHFLPLLSQVICCISDRTRSRLQATQSLKAGHDAGPMLGVGHLFAVLRGSKEQRKVLAGVGPYC